MYFFTLSGFRQHWGYVRIPDDVIPPKAIQNKDDKFSKYSLWLLELALEQKVITQKEYDDIL